MPLTHFWSTPRNLMGDRFNELISNGPETGDKRYAYACALFFFDKDNGFRHIPYLIKYQGDSETGKYFGKMLGRKMSEAAAWSNADMIIPVPLHWTRRWKRGYNQAEVIASAIADTLGAPMRTDILFRNRRTKTQTRLEVEEKAINVAGAFSINGNIDAEAQHILLIDDVFTTGSTLHACFVALRSVFPPSVRISVATLGFVGE